MALHNDYRFYDEHPADPVLCPDKIGRFVCVACQWAGSDGEATCPKCGSSAFEDLVEGFVFYAQRQIDGAHRPGRYLSRRSSAWHSGEVKSKSTQSKKRTGKAKVKRKKRVKK